MNYAVQNIVGIFLTLFFLSIAAYFLFLRQDGQYIPESWGDLGCMHIVNIKTSDLEPELKRGALLSMNDCLKDSGRFQENTVVLFEEESQKKLGIVISLKTVGRDIQYTVKVGTAKQVELYDKDITAYTVLPEKY